jgi:hypothetical protein
MPISILGFILLAAGGVCFWIGQMLRKQQPGQNVSGFMRRTAPARSVAAFARPAQADSIERAGDDKRGRFHAARIGQFITALHPVNGQFTKKIVGSIEYDELWQRRKDPSEPWVPTGNQFVAHWLGDLLIYEWKEQLFLLDQFDALTDQAVAQNFLPYAKKFGASDETATVQFTYPPATWIITDIGKFRVASANGPGLRLSAGAIGRFIHASGYDNRALVVEDYQSGGGGQDTAWIGYSIKWDDVQIE